MAIQTTGGDADVVDNSTRQLGQVGITSNYQDVYLPLILRELRRIALLINDAPSSASSLTSISSVLSADVTLTSTNTYFDGPSVTCKPGTWLLVGVATVHGTGAGVTTLSVKLWDGTTNFASGETHLSSPQTMTVPVDAIVSPTTTTTYKISVASDVITTTTISAAIADNPAGNTATYLLAVKIA